MANNLADRDAYIIIGVKDKTCEVVGVPETNRKNQQKLIDFLKDKKFARDMRPVAYVKTISINNNDIDVIIIKNTKDTPYYLIEDYSYQREIVRTGRIYTRVGDVNTSKKSIADDDKISYLWKKRFGLDLTSLEKAKFLLQTPNDWLPMGTDGKHYTTIGECNNVWYNKNNPEFTISYVVEEDNFDRGRINSIEDSMFWMNKLSNPPHHAYLYTLKVNHHSTIMFSTHAVFAENFEFKRILWSQKTLFENVSCELLKYSYIEKDSFELVLDDWLNNHYETVEKTELAEFFPSSGPRNNAWYQHGFNPYKVVLVFENSDEHERFIDYVKSRKDDFLEILGDYSFSDDEGNNHKCPAVYPGWIRHLCKAGEILVSWLENWWPR